jgi:hypothetical protein
MYHLIDGVVYQQGANGMMMRCISREEGIQLLQDIHNGVCESHSSWCSIIGKAFRHGFYWPIAKYDLMEVITKCKDCQFFQKQTSKYANPLCPIDLSWPFCNLGNRHRGHLAHGTRRIQILICQHRYLHQVDGGNASNKYHTRSSG